LTNKAAAGKRVLIVDDSVEYLSFMQLLLDAEGFEASTAATPTAMQEALKHQTPDLVISDVRIPGNNAFAVLDLLHADARTRRIPVLLCTGAVQEVEEHADRLKRDGVEVLFKPFDIEALLERVSRLCGLQRVAQG
jgi:DNA-binding response OmpR family regulator